MADAFTEHVAGSTPCYRVRRWFITPRRQTLQQTELFTGVKRKEFRVGEEASVTRKSLMIKPADNSCSQQPAPYLPLADAAAVIFLYRTF